MRRPVVVFGASGQIGHFLLPRLHAGGHAMVALSRRPQPALPGVSWLAGHLPDAVPPLPEASAIVCFGPLLPFARWLAATRPAGAPRIVATSSMSAQSKRDSPVASERAIAAELLEGEQRLAEACDAIGSAWTVLRPTLIYGAGRDRSLTPIVQAAQRRHLFPLPSGRGLRQPVHADDIAQAVVAALACPAAAGRILSIGGGERLSAREMFARVRRSTPGFTVPLPLPAWVLRLGSHAAPGLRGPLLRLDTDLVADNGPLERLLGMHPRPFRPDRSCWTGAPATAAPAAEG